MSVVSDSLTGGWLRLSLTCNRFHICHTRTYFESTSTTHGFILKECIPCKDTLGDCILISLSTTLHARRSPTIRICDTGDREERRADLVLCSPPTLLLIRWPNVSRSSRLRSCGPRFVGSSASQKDRCRDCKNGSQTPHFAPFECPPSTLQSCV